MQTLLLYTQFYKLITFGNPCLFGIHSLIMFFCCCCCCKPRFGFKFLFMLLHLLRLNIKDKSTKKNQKKSIHKYGYIIWTDVCMYVCTSICTSMYIFMYLLSLIYKKKKNIIRISIKLEEIFTVFFFVLFFLHCKWNTQKATTLKLRYNNKIKAATKKKTRNIFETSLLSSIESLLTVLFRV